MVRRPKWILLPFIKSADRGEQLVYAPHTADIVRMQFLPRDPGMSDELIRRQMTMAPRPSEVDLKTKLLAAAQAMRAAVAAYADKEQLFPLPMLGDCIPPAAPPAALHDARLRASREAILQELPKSGVGAEVGHKPAPSHAN